MPRETKKPLIEKLQKLKYDLPWSSYTIDRLKELLIMASAPPMLTVFVAEQVPLGKEIIIRNDGPLEPATIGERRRQVSRWKKEAKETKKIIRKDAVEKRKKIVKEVKGYDLEEVKDFVLETGVYQISFDMICHFKARDKSEPFHPSDKIVLKKDVKVSRVLEDMSRTYISKNYHDSEVQISAIRSIDVRKYDGKSLVELRMKGTPLAYKLLGEQPSIKNEGQCVPDYIMSEISGKERYRRYTRQDLIKDLGPQFLESGYHINDMISWATNRKNISLYALDMFGTVVAHVTAKDHTAASLVFRCNENHCYAVTDSELKLHVALAKRIDLQRDVFEIGGSSRTRRTITLPEQGSQLYDATEEIIYIIDRHDVCDVAADIIKRTSCMIEYGKYKKATLERFKHPTKNQIIVAADGYHKRKLVVDALYKLYGEVGFLWDNQSWSFLGKHFMDLEIGNFDVSYYSPEYMQILENHNVGPWVARMDKDEVLGTQTFDGFKCYTHLLLSNTFSYNVFNSFDDIEEYKGGELVAGEYCLSSDIWIAKGTIRITKWQPLVMINYLLIEGYITKEDIKFVMVASKIIRANLFARPVQKLMDMFPDDYKHIVNHYIGSLGKKETEFSKIGMTTSFESAVATKMFHDGKEIEMSKVGDIWFLRMVERSALTSGHLPIWRHIIAMSYIELDKMRKVICNGATRIVGYNTDSITVVHPRKEFIPVEKSVAVPGDICEEKFKNLRGTYIKDFESKEFVWAPKMWNSIKKEEMLTGCSGLVCGVPGSQKTTLLKTLYSRDIAAGKKVVVLGFTNASVANIKVVDPYTNVKVEAHTFDSFLLKENSIEEHIKKLCEYDVVMVDEASMVPKKKFPTLYAAWKRRGFVFRMFMDSNQCRSIERDDAKEYNDEMWVIYEDSYMIRDMCKNMCELPYMGGRYDEALRNELVTLQETKTLKWDNELFSEKECDFNIVMTLNMCDRINKQWFKARATDVKVVNDFRMYVGMPIISCKNFKQIQVYNAERYYVESIQERKIIVSNVTEIREIPLYYINVANFKVGFADTIYRVQGMTLRNKYNVWEVNQMKLQHIYTALSRATCKAHIGIKLDKTFVRELPTAKGKVITPRSLSIVVGYVYRIYDDDNEFVGQTLDVTQRFIEHKENPTSAKMKAWLATGKQTYEVIETVRFTDTKQLLTRERLHICMIKKNCMNTMHAVKTAVEQEAPKLENKIQEDRLHILDDEKGMEFRINYTENGRYTRVKKHYTRENKQAKLILMEEIRVNLIKKLYT